MSTKKKLELPAIQTCEYIALTDIISDDLGDCWELIAENAPFTWGDNDRTLVTASRLHDHIADMLDECPKKKAVKRVLAVLDALGETYVDLES